MKMTTEEAFIKVLQMHGIEHAFGIIGSAMMPISDLFPTAGIKFWDCAHEVNAGMSADGYTRVTGKMSEPFGSGDTDNERLGALVDSCLSKLERTLRRRDRLQAHGIAGLLAVLVAAVASVAGFVLLP